MSKHYHNLSLMIHPLSSVNPEQASICEQCQAGKTCVTKNVKECRSIECSPTFVASELYGLQKRAINNKCFAPFS